MSGSSNAAQGTASGVAQTIGDMAKGVHGVGETIRGTFNSTVDSAAGEAFENKKGVRSSENEATLSKGEAEMKKGQAAMAYD